MDNGSISNVAHTTAVPKAAASLPVSASAQSAAPAASAAPVETAKAVTKPAAVPSQEQLHKALEEINKTIEKLSPGLEFSVDPELKDLNKTVVKVVDQSTKEVLRQIPTEETLSIAKALDKLQGLLIKEQA
ncbi:MAG TPA: flagellar protein FlaG [Noviherbaspirillum sp.]